MNERPDSWLATWLIPLEDPAGDLVPDRIERNLAVLDGWEVQIRDLRAWLEGVNDDADTTHAALRPRAR